MKRCLLPPDPPTSPNSTLIHISPHPPSVKLQHSADTPWMSTIAHPKTQHPRSTATNDLLQLLCPSYWPRAKQLHRRLNSGKRMQAVEKRSCTIRSRIST